MAQPYKHELESGLCITVPVLTLDNFRLWRITLTAICEARKIRHWLENYVMCPHPCQNNCKREREANDAKLVEWRLDNAFLMSIMYQTTQDLYPELLKQGYKWDGTQPYSLLSYIEFVMLAHHKKIV